MTASPPSVVSAGEAEQLKGMLARMMLIRAFEAAAVELATTKQLHGGVHASSGQEAVGVGVCAALRPDDYALTTHRGHGHVLAKGADPKPMMAELFGRAAGSNHGKGGSYHITDVSRGVLGAISVLGENMPFGVGAALGSVVLGQGRVAVVFFGDGSASEGALHESLNFAGIRKLPVIFVCEDNSYAVNTRTREAGSVQHPGDLGVAYHVPSVTVDGNDVFAVREAATQAVARARAGEGPTLLDCKTYRHFAHNTGYPDMRPAEERVLWLARDPIDRLRTRLVELGVMRLEEAARLEQAAAAEVEAAVAYGRACPYPGVEEALTDVYAPAYAPPVARGAGPETEVLFKEAIRQALDHEMGRDLSVILMGTSAAFGGWVGTAAGLFQKYGPVRVLNTPIAELAMAGVANGAAVVGCRPIVDFSHNDFTGLALDQICNLSAKLRHMTGGQARVPAVFRLQWGAPGGAAQTHSQSLEAWYYHLPGLKVVAPSTPADARGLLLTAIRDDNPVVFLEHRGLHNTSGPVPASMDALPFGQAAVRRVGGDVSLIGWGRMVHHALAVAEELAAEGVEAEVIDLRSLYPLDVETMCASVARTGRAVICQEAVLQGGVGSDLVRIIDEQVFDELRAPARVVGSAWAPIPYTPGLERAVIPGPQQIRDAVQWVLGSGRPR
ncbi:MAG: dehydrogenase [Chloroflexi bacterium]|nr:dehydrogenase [Chloroflexota bacterium]